MPCGAGCDGQMRAMGSILARRVSRRVSYRRDGLFRQRWAGALRAYRRKSHGSTKCCAPPTLRWLRIFRRRLPLSGRFRGGLSSGWMSVSVTTPPGQSGRWGGIARCFIGAPCLSGHDRRWRWCEPGTGYFHTIAVRDGGFPVGRSAINGRRWPAGVDAGQVSTTPSRGGPAVSRCGCLAARE